MFFLFYSAMLMEDASDGYFVRLGTTFVTVDEDEFNEYLEDEREDLESMLKDSTEEMGPLDEEKATLKATLYSRFGKTINLED